MRHLTASVALTLACMALGGGPGGQTALAAAPNPQAQGKALTQAFLAAYAKADHFIGTVRSLTHSATKSNETVMKVWMKKPNHTAFLILQAPQKPSSVGTKLVWHGDDPKVTLRTRFFGLPITMRTGYDDARLNGVRGDTLMDLAVTTAVDMVKHPAATFEVLGKSSWNGRTLHLVKLRSPKLLRGITHEILGLDDATKLPLTREMYEGPKQVYRMEVQNFQLDGPWPADAFEVTGT